MTMARTEPRTLAAAFMAQAHSTALSAPGDRVRRARYGAGGERPQAGGERHSHYEAERDQQHSADEQAVAESEAHPGHQNPRKKNHVGDKRCNYQHEWHPGQFGARQPAARKQAAGAAREHEQKDHHGERVGRMSEKKHEALDEGDLHQNVAEPDGDEIKQRKRRLHRAGLEGQRQNKKRARPPDMK